MAKVRASEKERSRAQRKAVEKEKQRMEAVEKESKKRRKRAEATIQNRLEAESKRKMGRGPGDPLAGTSREGGEFQVIQGRYFDRATGTYYGKDEDAGEYVESDLPLDELFANKFRRIGSPTRLGRDERRNKVIDSNVMDRPLPQRIEDDLDDETEDDAEDDADEEDEEDGQPSIRGKVRRAPKANDEDGVEANPMPEEDEEGEEVDKAARYRKEKRAKARGRRK